MTKATASGACKAETGNLTYFISWVDTDNVTFGNFIVKLPYDKFFDEAKIKEVEKVLSDQMPGNPTVKLLSFQRLG